MSNENAPRADAADGYDRTPPASTGAPAPPIEAEPAEKAARESAMAARAANPVRQSGRVRP